VISFFIAAWYIKSFQHIEFNKKSLRISLKDTKEMATIGMSASLNQIAILFVQIVLNNSLTYYGQFTKFGSDIPLAACGIVMKTNAILLAIIIGISQGMQPIIGFNYGAQKYERVKKTFKLAISANLVVSFIGWALFQFCTSTVLSIFGSGDANYFEFATMFMRIYLMLVCIDGVQMLSSSFFASIKKAYLGMFLSMTRQVLFLIPLVLILPKFFGLNGILYAAPIADFVAFVVSVICILAEFKKLNELEKSRKTNSL
jgi:Na+-driven multidrug efflux pump